MNKRSVVSLLVLVGLMLMALTAACGGGVEETPDTPSAQKTPEETSDAPAQGGEELLESRCTRCHNLDRVKAASKTLDEWTVTVERMRGKGADLADAEAEILMDYLAETYGP